jgi:4-amino-4-deoxy-L-arabinose transferase-like glycosyltransferase
MSSILGSGESLLSRLRRSLSLVYVAMTDRLVHNERAFLVALFVAALALRLIYLLAFVGLDTQPEYDGIGYDQLATGLLEGRGYVNAWGEPTAFRPPVYPLFLAGVYTLTDHSLGAVRVAQAIMDAATAIIVYFIARELFGQRVAVLAGIGVALYPLLIYETGLLIPESLSYTLQFAAVWCLVVMLRRDGAILPLLAGVLMGLTVLARPTATLWVPLVLAWVLLIGSVRKALPRLAAMLLGLGLIFGPWVARNCVTFQTFTPISSNGAVNIWCGNNPLAQGGSVQPDAHTWNGDDYPTRGLYGWEGQNEVESNRRFAEKGWAWIRENPEQFIMLAPRKLLRLWSPVSYSVQFGRRASTPLAILAIPLYAVFLGVAGHGIVVSRRKWRELFPLLAIIISINSLVILYYGATRYGIPIGISLLIFAAVSIDKLLARPLRYREEWAALRDAGHQDAGGRQASPGRGTAGQ